MGFVYFIQDERNSFFKIGSTTDSAELRLQQLQVGNPRELRVFGAIECDDPVEKEKEIQDIWDSKCVRGEWFDFSERQAFDILKAHGGHRYSNPKQPKVKLKTLVSSVPLNTERETVVLLAYEKAIQKRSNPSTCYIEKITEELGNRVPRTSVWHILNALKSEGRLPVLNEQCSKSAF